MIDEDSEEVVTDGCIEHVPLKVVDSVMRL